MANEAIGLGAIVKVDDDKDTTFTTVGCIPEFTPPGNEREEVEMTCLEDTLEDWQAGIDKADEFEFMQIWDPLDTNHKIIDTLYAAKTSVPWQCILPFGTPVTGAFEGYVSKIKPEKVEKNQPIRRTVTVRRKTGITWS
jgi:hypothetical protein